MAVKNDQTPLINNKLTTTTAPDAWIGIHALNFLKEFTAENSASSLNGNITILALLLRMREQAPRCNPNTFFHHHNDNGDNAAPMISAH